jgi:hypothetical protein
LRWRKLKGTVSPKLRAWRKKAQTVNASESEREEQKGGGGDELFVCVIRRPVLSCTYSSQHPSRRADAHSIVSLLFSFHQHTFGIYQNIRNIRTEMEVKKTKKGRQVECAARGVTDSPMKEEEKNEKKKKREGT